MVDFAKANGANVIIKGLRTVADFEYEFQMALLNKALNPEYETMFLMTDTKYSYISSSMVDVYKRQAYAFSRVCRRFRYYRAYSYSSD